MPLIGFNLYSKLSALSWRAGFLAVVIATAAPLTLLMSWLIAQQLRNEQANFESALQESATSFARSVDQEFTSSIAALNILAIADTLQRDDLAGFFNSVATLPTELGRWQSVFLIRPNGEVLINTRQPQGKPLGTFTAADALEKLKQTARPVSTDLIVGPDGQLKSAVLVPVIIKGQVRYALGAWIAPEFWQHLINNVTPFLKQTKGDITLLDSRLRQVARHRGGIDLMAPSMPPWLQEQLQLHPSGMGLDGPNPATAPQEVWQNVGPSKWRILVVVPAWPWTIDRIGRATEIGLACLLIWAAAMSFAFKLARWFSDRWRTERPPLQAAPESPAHRVPPERDIPHEVQEADLIELAQSVGHVGFFNHAFSSHRVTWTSGLSRLLDLSLSQSEGPVRVLLRRLHPQDRKLLQQQVKQAIRNRRGQITVEGRCRPVDQNERWLSCRLMISYDDQHQATSMTGVVTDVSQQKMLDRERAALMAREQLARRDAENANRAKDEFLAMLGHELRNPLGAISAACEVLNRAEAQQEVAQRARQIIARQTSHLSRLMDDLLDVFRVISGKILLVRSPLLLGQVVQRVVHTMELAGHLRAHKLTVQLHDVWVYADATRLEQVITNLLSNAVKYTPEHGHIDIHLHQVDTAAVLQVRDSGVGMTPELMSRVFELFVQGERTMDRPQGGLGIGLALVRRLTELHGGEVTVESEGPGRGCLFTVRLPLAQAAAEPDTSQPRPGSRASRRVVIVEDNQDAREAICSLLTLNHHETYTAVDGQSGLDLILKIRPDVALIDIGLPGLTGYEVAQHLRQAGYSGNLIAVSGYGQPADVYRAHSAGFNEHLVKPVDPVLLDQMISPSSEELAIVSTP